MLCTVIVPCYNEEAVLAETYKRLTDVMQGCGMAYELLFINDGSRDATLSILKKLNDEDARVKIVSFSRNFGHMPALTAGMDHAAGDAVVVIDADLQDPPSVIPDMLAKWREGYGVVYGRRTKRKGENILKLATAKIFYRFLNRLSDVNIPLDAGEFRLLDRKVVDAMKRLPEHNRYPRGLSSWVGFTQTHVDYIREERFAGETKYPLRRMLKLAVDGMVSFSYKPLGLAALCGVLTVGLAKAGLITALVLFLLGRDIGAVIWLGLTIIALLGLIMILLGITGTYIARILDEVRGRPLYVVGETVGLDA